MRKIIGVFMLTAFVITAKPALSEVPKNWTVLKGISRVGVRIIEPGFFEDMGLKPRSIYKVIKTKLKAAGIKTYRMPGNAEAKEDETALSAVFMCDCTEEKCNYSIDLYLTQTVKSSKDLAKISGITWIKTSRGESKPDTVKSVLLERTGILVDEFVSDYHSVNS